MNRIFTFKHGRSRAIIAGVCSIVFAVSLSAQVTSVKLPRFDSLASFQVQDNASTVKLRVNGDGGFYVGGTLGTGVIPATGAGVRMMWYPAKAAFRAGYVSGTEWDDANVGQLSIATGYSTTASGYVSMAGGRLSTASGPGTVALGYEDTASGQGAVAIGYAAKAIGDWSTAIGAMVTSSGRYSTAMGRSVSTNYFGGSFIIGDNSTTTTTNSTTGNQMTMRFAGGYRLFTDAAVTMGVSLAPGASSWGTISDSTKKTNFVKADHDYFLSSLSKLRLGSWNYKAQDAKAYRHYGPMAQEIYHYFGHDGKGTIGCDTLLASADMDGIMMVCLQALEKRTGELQKANEQIAELKQQVSEQKVFQQKSISSLTEKIEKLGQLVYSSSTKNKEQLTLNTSKE